MREELIMGDRGKAPTPTKLRLLHGETRPSRINYNEPQPASMEPECPDYFTPDAREVWDRVVIQLRAMDLLAAADQDMLAAYCQAVAKYQKAVRMIDASDLLLRGRDGNAVTNPAYRMMRDLAGSIRVLGNEFGFSPAARVGLTTKDKPSLSAGAERLLS
jgi:P27 family predicted phage terminase small subunit